MNKKVIIAIFIIFLIVVIWLNPFNKKKENNGNITNNVNNNMSKNSIKIDEKELKESVEKTEDGIEISNVKINKNENNIITISLDVKNTNVDKKNVDIAVVFYNENGNEIGRNGFNIGMLNPSENKKVENNCYILENDLEVIDLEINVQEIEDDGKEGREDNEVKK